MLESVGVGPEEERAYRCLLRRPGCTLSELARELDESADALRHLVLRLEELGLLSRTPDRPSRLLPARPDVAVDVLAARRRAQLDQAQTAARDLLSELETPQRYRPENLVEVIVGRRAIAARFAQLMQSTQEELLVLDRPPYASAYEESDGQVRGLLRDGVRVRGIYSPDSLQQPGAVDEAYSAVDAGETSRMHPDVPIKLAISDRSLALLPLAVEEMVDSALVVHRSGLLDALVSMFDLLWAQAMPVAPESTDGLGGEMDQRLLTMLVGGLKDDAIARQLSVSSRTVGRRIADLMSLLGARTRFQAGVYAQQRSLLGSPELRE